MGEEETLAVAGRIKQFIDYLGITITQFADNTGIQRSSMSQILGGRNQKISIATIGKIHATYPELSIYWLLYGHGDMLTFSPDDDGESERGNDSTRLSAGTPPYLSLFDAENAANPANDANNRKYSRENESNRGYPAHEKFENEDLRSNSGTNIDSRTISEKNRRIVKIMIFYSDNTFESFSPDSSD